MRLNKKTICLTWCIAIFFSFTSCRVNEGQGVMPELTDGFWEDISGNAPLVRFSESGQVFYYVYAPSDYAGRYDAYYDTSIQNYTKYAIDLSNGRFCFLPDRWYDIKVSNGSVFTLKDDAGEIVKYNKVPSSSICVMSGDDYLNKHPEDLRKN